MAEQDNKLVTVEETLPAELTEEQKEKIKQALKVESEELLVELSKTQDPQKNKDLTYLFQLNNSKKAMLRQNKINELMDNTVDKLTDRVDKHSDEIPTETLIKIATTAQGILDRNTLITTPNQEQNLIQINKHETTINVNQDVQEDKKLTSQQRKNIDSVVSKILGNVLRNSEAQPEEDVILDADVAEVKESKDGSEE